MMLEPYFMPSKTRIFDEKTVLMNYLVDRYIQSKSYFADVNETLRKKRIIKEAVDEIFLIHWDRRDPHSRQFHRLAVRSILKKMAWKLIEDSVKIQSSAAK